MDLVRLLLGVLLMGLGLFTVVARHRIVKRRERRRGRSRLSSNAWAGIGALFILLGVLHIAVAAA